MEFYYTAALPQAVGAFGGIRPAHFPFLFHLDKFCRTVTVAVGLYVYALIVHHLNRK